MSLVSGFDPLYSLSGLVVGTIVGMTGVGGGSLMTPLLVLLFGVHPATAVGTDLLYAGLTKAVGTASHGRKGQVDWAVVGSLALGSVPASLLTLWLLHRVGLDAKATSAIISYGLGLALLLTAATILLRQRLRAAFEGRPEPSASLRRIGGIGLGALLGVLVSITSVGAGALGVTVLALLYPRLDTPKLVGSDIAHAVPLTLIAGLGYWTLGSIDWLLLGSLLLGSIPGILIGSHLAGRVPERALRLLLAAVLTLVGGRLLAA